MSIFIVFIFPLLSLISFVFRTSIGITHDQLYVVVLIRYVRTSEGEKRNDHEGKGKERKRRSEGKGKGEIRTL
jgi:hypothetical protein